MANETAPASNTSTLLTVLSLALQAISARAVIFVSLIMTFSLFCWAVWAHGRIELATAIAFAVLVFLPVWFKRKE